MRCTNCGDEEATETCVRGEDCRVEQVIDVMRPLLQKLPIMAWHRRWNQTELSYHISTLCTGCFLDYDGKCFHCLTRPAHVEREQV